MLCFHGGSVGHKSTHAATDFFKKDHDCLDIRTRPQEHDNTKLEEPTESDSDDSEALSDDEILDEDEPEKAESGMDKEEEDFGIRGLKEQAVNSDSESKSDPDETPLVLEDPNEEDFGPEGDGMGPDPDMDELGYDKM